MEFLIGVVVGGVAAYFLLQNPTVQEFIAKLKS